MPPDASADHHVESAPELLRALGACGDARPWVWTSTARSASWLAGIPDIARVNHIPGLGTLLDPARREARLRPRFLSSGGTAAVWPRTFPLPEEAEALRRSLGPEDEVLLLRHVDSSWLERWRVVPAADVPWDAPALARPIQRQAEDQLVATDVVIRASDPCHAMLRGAPPEDLKEAVSRILACVHPLLDPRGEGDFALVRFEWRARGADAAAELVDVARIGPEGWERELVQCVESDPGADCPGFQTLALPRLDPTRSWQVGPVEVGPLEGLPVLFDARDGRLLPLDTISAFVWRSIERGLPPEEATREIAEATGADQATVARDVEALLGRWAAAELAWPSDQDQPAFPAGTVGRRPPPMADLPNALLARLDDVRAARADAMSPEQAPRVEEDTHGRMRLDAQAALPGTPTPWLPDVAWLVAPLIEAWSGRAAEDRLVLRGVLVHAPDALRLLVSENPDVAMLAAARARKFGMRVLGAPFVHVAATGHALLDTPGALLVPDVGDARDVLGAAAASKPLPRILGPHVHLHPLDAPPPGADRQAIDEICMLVDRGRIELSPTQALAQLARHGLRAGAPLGVHTARGLVALVDRTPVVRVALDAWHHDRAEETP